MASQEMSALPQYHGLSQRYGGRTVLDDIDLSLQPGRCALLLGENGAGKSTLLRVMAGLLKPQAGQVFIDQQLMSWAKARRPLRTQVMYLHQTPYLFDGSVEKNLKLVSPTKAADANRDRIQQSLGWAGLAHLSQHSAKQLSGGEKQRLALARARLRQSPVLLLDEPTSNLDSDSRQKTLSLLNNLKQAGTCLLIACHDPDSFADIADGQYVLNHGRLE